MLKVPSEALEACRRSHMGDFLRLILIFLPSFLQFGLGSRVGTEMISINCYWGSASVKKPMPAVIPRPIIAVSTCNLHYWFPSTVLIESEARAVPRL
ncbi:hypothetical protein Q3G72_030014 [Acer saccharum]|nr:hypothetical protein Q3G72_030014 [Acer saccharum]